MGSTSQFWDVFQIEYDVSTPVSDSESATYFIYQSFLHGVPFAHATGTELAYCYIDVYMSVFDSPSDVVPILSNNIYDVAPPGRVINGFAPGYISGFNNSDLSSEFLSYGRDKLHVKTEVSRHGYDVLNASSVQVADLSYFRESFDAIAQVVPPQLLSFDFEGIITHDPYSPYPPSDPDIVGKTVRGTVTYNANPAAMPLNPIFFDQDYYRFRNYGIRASIDDVLLDGSSIDVIGVTDGGSSSFDRVSYVSPGVGELTLTGKDGQGNSFFDAGVIPAHVPRMSQLRSGHLSLSLLGDDGFYHYPNATITSLGEVDNRAAKLVTASPVTLLQVVDVPSTPFNLSFDYDFLGGVGSLQIFLDDILLETVGSAGSSASLEFESISVPVGGSLLGLSQVDLEFVFDGPPGAILLLDNISFPGIANGGFETDGLSGWTAVVSPGGIADVVAASVAPVPEPSTIVVFATGTFLVGLRRRDIVLRQRT